MRIRRLVAINALVLVTLLLAAEGAARVWIYLTLGRSTAGLAERFLHLRYQPFTMFGRDLDVDRHLGRLRETGAVPDPTRYRVLLLGGSTAARFPSTMLEAALAERFPRQRVEVVNLAHGGYNARQALVVLALWGVRLAPSLVITLDGFNDLDQRLRADRPGTFLLDPAYRLLLTRPFVAPFAEILRHSQLVHGLTRLQARYTLGPAADYLDAVPAYLDAQHSINVIARGLGAARLMVLQPFNAYKKPLTDQEAAFTHYQYREAVTMALLDKTAEGLQALATRDGVRFLDARPVYGGMQETIFGDDVHFAGTRGYEVLAVRIAKSVPGPER